jgi:hypothetical protein
MVYKFFFKKGLLYILIQEILKNSLFFLGFKKQVNTPVNTPFTPLNTR